MNTKTAITDKDLLLVDYACGTLDETHTLLAAAYTAVSPIASKTLAQHEQLGGVMMEQYCEPVVMRSSSLDMVLSQIDGSQQPEDLVPDASAKAPNDLRNFKFYDKIPEVVKHHLALQPKKPKWVTIYPGVRMCDVITRENEFKVSLLQVDPGVKTPSHDHHGVEMTLVLDGAFHDDSGNYGTGELVITEEHEDHHHEPIACENEGCVCLIVTDAPVRFTGPFMRIMNFFQ